MGNKNKSHLVPRHKYSHTRVAVFRPILYAHFSVVGNSVYVCVCVYHRLLLSHKQVGGATPHTHTHTHTHTQQVQPANISNQACCVPAKYVYSHSRPGLLCSGQNCMLTFLIRVALFRPKRYAHIPNQECWLPANSVYFPIPFSTQEWMQRSLWRTSTTLQRPAAPTSCWRSNCCCCPHFLLSS